MEMFKILGTIAIDNKGAIQVLNDTSSAAKKTAGNIGEVGESGEKSGGKFGSAMKKMGSAALAVTKVIGTGMIAAGTAVAGLVTKSVQSYAEYEQLVGGVETLFKDSADKVMEYANNAYKTAGLSANAYMETVTSFSASLLQSLDGDTAKAAQKADQAIIDMSDNANKMGTSMEMIQNAYQGFAKANYTMLDNLKLGYGGTQEEMQRLLKDAEAISGIKYDISSYADVVDAIHVIQTEMGITGTTAKEAASTISGSINMMKASWTNMITAMSDENADFGSYVNNFVDSVSAVAENLMPRIEIALNGVAQLIDKLAPVIISKVPQLLATLLPSVVSAITGILNAASSALPGVISSIVGMLPSLINAFKSIIAGLAAELPSIIQTLVGAIGELIPVLADALESGFVALCGLLPQIVQPILMALPGLVETLVTTLIGMVPALLEGVRSLLSSLIGMLPTIIPVLLEAIVSIFTMLIGQLPVLIPMLVDMVIQLVTMLAGQLPIIIPQLIQAVIQMVNLLIGQLPVILPVLIQALSQLLVAVVGMLPTLIPVLVEMATSLVNMLVEQIPILIPLLIQALIDATIAINDALIQSIPSLISMVIASLLLNLRLVWEAIVLVFVELPKWFFQLFVGVVEMIIKAFSSVVGLFDNIWGEIKNVFAIVGEWFGEQFGKAKEAVSNAWSTVTEFFGGIWDGVVSVFSDVAGWFSEKFNSAKTKAVSAFDDIKTKFTEIKDKVLDAFSTIKTKLAEPFEKAKETISGVADKIYSLFKGEISMPKIKTPHFTISPSGWSVGDLLKGKIPKLGISWYAKAMENPMIMTKPTIFGYDGSTGKLMGGGEAGSEVVSGTDTLMNMIQAAVAAQNETLAYYLQKVIEMLAEYFPEALEAMRTPASFVPDEMAAALAVPMDRHLGILYAQKGRGR